MGWLAIVFGGKQATDQQYDGQDVVGENDKGCPYIGQSVDTAVSPQSLVATANLLGITVKELKAMLNS